MTLVGRAELYTMTPPRVGKKPFREMTPYSMSKFIRGSRNPEPNHVIGGNCLAGRLQVNQDIWACDINKS